MLYNSTEFVIFFAAICLILYLVPHKARNLYLLIVSYIFCAMYSPVFVPFLAVMTLFSYIAGRAIERSRKTWAFALVLIVLFAPLAFLKYYAFFASLLTEGLGAMHIRVSIPALTLVQPVGLSFYSFMAGGYLIDVWKGKISAERNILRYALFLSFFPTQSAGPIERADLFLPQLEKKRPFSWDGVQTGLLYMLWGYIEKSVIADNIKPMVDAVFSDFGSFSSGTLALTVLLYTMEIYCDFAGYSNLALGAGKVMGFDLIQNFRSPYFAGSVAGFWRRWHISLTKWFTDYIYIPLGGSRRGKLRQYRNIMIVFLVSGLWHGAAVHFVIWGAVNGIYQIAGKILMPVRNKICGGLGIDREAFSHRLLKTAVTFVLIALSWVFFRADSVRQALSYLKRLVTGPVLIRMSEINRMLPDKSTRQIVLIAAMLAFFLLVMTIVDYLTYKDIDVAGRFVRQGAWLKILVFVFLIMSVAVFGKYGPAFDEAAFIYTQF